MTLAIIGLGYVGLPLAVGFGKQRPVLGFDINAQRITQLQAGHDATLEVTQEELAEAAQLRFTANPEDLRQATIYIVTVPSPIDRHKQPDLRPLRAASETIGKVLKPGDIVVYESTVYPGCTEEECVPVLERASGLTFNRDFFAGYSPERINPGDKVHRVANITKVTAGSTFEVADTVDQLYASKRRLDISRRRQLKRAWGGLWSGTRGTTVDGPQEPGSVDKHVYSWEYHSFLFKDTCRWHCEIKRCD